MADSATSGTASQPLAAIVRDSKAHDVEEHPLTSSRGIAMGNQQPPSKEQASDARGGADNAQRTDTIRAMTARVKRYSEALWGCTPTDTTRIEGLLQEAYRVHDVPLNEEAATQWGKENFPGGRPQSAVDECENALQQKRGDFAAMAQERLTEILPGSTID